MKSCPKCNMSGISDDAKFCPKCGARLSSNTARIIAVLSLIVAAIVMALLLYQSYIKRKEAKAQQEFQRYLTELAQNAPSGFIKGVEEDWIYQDYQRFKSDSIIYYHSILNTYYSWYYNAECELQLREIKCSEYEYFSYHGDFIGFAHYFGPNFNYEKSHHKYYVKGTINNGVWIFDTFDKEGKKYDHFEGGWSDGVLTGICTNKKGTEIKFKFYSSKH